MEEVKILTEDERIINKLDKEIEFILKKNNLHTILVEDYYGRFEVDTIIKDTYDNSQYSRVLKIRDKTYHKMIRWLGWLLVFSAIVFVSGLLFAFVFKILPMLFS